MRLIPLAHNSKKPFAGEDWHARISDDPSVHAEWLRQGFNLGLDVEGSSRVVVDFDDKDAAREFYKRYTALCTVMVETLRGIHFHFIGSTKTRKLIINGKTVGDIKGNGYTLMPPSKVDGHQYRYLANGELQPFPDDVLSETRANLHSSLTREKVKRLESYLAKVESKQGENGSAGLVRAVAVCRDSGVTEAEATVYLLKWNQGSSVVPPWPEMEIARAVTRIYRKP